MVAVSQVGGNLSQRDTAKDCGLTIVRNPKNGKPWDEKGKRERRTLAPACECEKHTSTLRDRLSLGSSCVPAELGLRFIG